jgi:hypothetical protein
MVRDRYPDWAEPNRQRTTGGTGRVTLGEIKKATRLSGQRTALKIRQVLYGASSLTSVDPRGTAWSRSWSEPPASDDS